MNLITPPREIDKNYEYTSLLLDLELVPFAELREHRGPSSRIKNYNLIRVLERIILTGRNFNLVARGM